MKSTNLKTLVTTALLALAASFALAAPPADWSRVPAANITVFYPGVTPMEWLRRGTDHDGARAMRRGETCASCHHEEAADMGRKILGDRRLEPTPIAGKAPAIPVTVQAAHDGTNLYLRFAWRQPPGGGGAPMDRDNQVKLSVMFDDNKVPGANLSGCWEACHADVRTMPGANDQRTKYVRDANLAGGIFYDLLMWTSRGARYDGHVADRRVMEGGRALVAARGEKRGDEWVVVFTRRFVGGPGDVTLAPGRTYNFGFAIHDNHSAGRFHHVSLGYTLGIDARADVTAARR